jgi:hypothetical protein
MGEACVARLKRGLSEAQKRIYAAEMNLARRQLTGAQKVLLGTAIERDIADEAEARMLAGRTPDPQDNCPEGPAPQTRDIVAKTVGLGSGRNYERSKQVLDALKREEDGPQLIQHVASGDWDMDDVRRLWRT